MEEIWMPIKNYEEKYQVSNLGRVRSLDLKTEYSDNRNRVHKGVILRLTPDKYGYVKINLTLRNKHTTQKIHRLVAKAFIPNPENKPQVNHINGVKTDNRVENLEWVTQSENMKHARKMGLIKSPNGTSNYWSKLTDNQVFKIKNCHKNMTSKDVADMYDVSGTTIRLIRAGKKWKHIAAIGGEVVKIAVRRKCDTCGIEYTPTLKSLKKGQGLTCSRSCSALKREKIRKIK